MLKKFLVVLAALFAFGKAEARVCFLPQYLYQDGCDYVMPEITRMNNPNQEQPDGNNDSCDSGYNIASPVSTYGSDYLNCYDCSLCEVEGDARIGKYKCALKTASWNWTDRSSEHYWLDSDGRCTAPFATGGCTEGIDCGEDRNHVGDPICELANGRWTYESCSVKKTCDGNTYNQIVENFDDGEGVCYFESYDNLRDYPENYAKIGTCLYSGNTAVHFNQYVKLHLPDTTGDGVKDCYGQWNPIHGRVPCTDPTGGTNCYGTDSQDFACTTAPSEGCTAKKWNDVYWCSTCASDQNACYYVHEERVYKDGVALNIERARERFVFVTDPSEVEDITVNNTSQGMSLSYRSVPWSDDYGYITSEICTNGHWMSNTDEGTIYTVGGCNRVNYARASYAWDYIKGPAYNTITQSEMECCLYSTDVGARYTYDSNSNKTGELTGEGNGIKCGSYEYFDECRCQESEENQECLDDLLPRNDKYLEHPKVEDGTELKACFYRVHVSTGRFRYYSCSNVGIPHDRCCWASCTTDIYSGRGYLYYGGWETVCYKKGLGCNGEKTVAQLVEEGVLKRCPNGGTNCQTCDSGGFGTYSGNYCEVCAEEYDECIAQFGQRSCSTSGTCMGYNYTLEVIGGRNCYFNVQAKICADYKDEGYPDSKCVAGCSVCTSARKYLGSYYGTCYNNDACEGTVTCTAPDRRDSCVNSTFHNHSSEVSDTYCANLGTTGDPANCGCIGNDGYQYGWCY